MSVKIINCVTTDLVTDQRVFKISSSLANAGYDLLVVGRLRPNSKELPERSYRTIRFKLWFDKGPLFYATYNIRLFLFLLFSKADIYIANDLDTLLAVYLASKIKGVKMAYDNHEYFCGVPELIKRPIVRKIWRAIESHIFPKMNYVYTDNDSKKLLFERDYKVPVKVVKNVPIYIENETEFPQIDLPSDKIILIYQGAGINIDRGTEELTMAMNYLDDRFLLLFVGSGDVIDILKQMVKDHHLQSKVTFVDKVSLDKLKAYTRKAHLGLTLDKPVSDNYTYSLPNKLFDYVHGGIPVLATKLVEIEKMITKYDIGTFVDSHDPKHIADRIRYIFDHPDLILNWKNNLPRAAREVNWQEEEKVLLSIYSEIKHTLSK